MDLAAHGLALAVEPPRGVVRLGDHLDGDGFGRSARTHTADDVGAQSVGPARPMEGIKVVELGFWVAGPSCAAILADWGADVVKVEPLTGDPFRGMTAYFQAALGYDVNPPFELDNRGKRSIGLDYGTDEGRRVLHDLVAAADVFVTNLRLDGLERAGLDHAALTARHPRLVYASVSGLGLEGD